MDGNKLDSHVRTKEGEVHSLVRNDFVSTKF
jgi:hypothetical protein